MPRSSSQKLKILYIMDYLLRRTDEDHPVTTTQLVSMLAGHGISAERKSIYDDLEALRAYGLDIISAGSGRASGYYVGSRDFQLPELKLLVDSIQSSKFITESKSMELISKLESLSSVYEAELLHRQIHVANRVKTMNESIYYNVDAVHRAIAQNSRLRFHYFEFTVQKERRLRRDGAWYTLSPYALTWDDENYYMVAYDSAADRIKHFRVDKMADIQITGDPRDGQDAYRKLDMGIYARKTFGMFTGEETSVRLRFENSLVGAVLDRLGRDVSLIPDGEAHFTVRTNIVLSPQFYAWVCGFGPKARILDPAEVVQGMKDHLAAVTALYE